MKYLLDTNALLFWLEDSKRLRAAVRRDLASPVNSVYVSAVSTFEIAVKAGIGRISLPDSPAKLLPPLLARSGLLTLPISIEHSFGVYDLPLHHGDPFDRLLVSQARLESMTLVTSDKQLAAYDIEVIVLR